jgi:hypothetical protein
LLEITTLSAPRGRPDTLVTRTVLDLDVGFFARGDEVKVSAQTPKEVRPVSVAGYMYRGHGEIRQSVIEELQAHVNASPQFDIEKLKTCPGKIETFK